MAISRKGRVFGTRGFVELFSRRLWLSSVDGSAAYILMVKEINRQCSCSLEGEHLRDVEKVAGSIPAGNTTVSDVTAGRKNEVKRGISRRYDHDGW